MPFKFAWLCELLNQLDQNRFSRAASSSRAINPDDHIIVSWFNKYSHQINRKGEDGVAFLSCLFPEHRSDRVYNLQETRLSSIFGRALLLSAKRTARLNAWKDQNGADFASCVEEVMQEAEFDIPSPQRAVTLDEIHQVLDQIAANTPYSSPKFRSHANEKSPDDLLRPIVGRLQSSEAKWLVRMLMKSFSPVQIPEYLTMYQFHFLLPKLLAVQNNFEAALAVLNAPTLSSLPPRPTKEYEKALVILASETISPQLGVMVKRQPYDKARSIKHCCQMIGQRTMSVEKKYDGEYCQVHINMEARTEKIQIFSKSGKDSTVDRIRLHGAIEDALQLQSNNCPIKRRCILEGELLVWSCTQQSIQHFSKIRKHVKHGGRSIGTDFDSPASPDENLLIVFYDILLLDDTIYLHKLHRERRSKLESLVSEITGFADLGERVVIDFGSPRAPEQFRSTVARGITDRWEGFVLKGCDDPYFSWSKNSRGIKLKKDYIKGLGDTADMAIVGGSHDHIVEQELGLGRLFWTAFHLACLENKEDVRRYNAKPVYRIVGFVTQRCISKDDIALLNRLGQFHQTNFALSIAELDIRLDPGILLPPSSLFRKPFVADIYGAGFEKLSNASYYTIRFPRVEKIHEDRGIEDIVSFDELQNLADKSTKAPECEDSQENREWIARLVLADGKSDYIIDKSQTTTPGRSTASAITASASPNLRRKRKSPPLIRCDTDELSPGEKLFRKYEQPVEQRNHRSDDQETTSSPCSHVESIHRFPIANSSSKRRRLSSANATASQPARKDRISPQPKEITASSEKSKTRSTPVAPSTSFLKQLQRTPPWCRPSSRSRSVVASPFEPPAVFSGANHRQSNFQQRRTPRTAKAPPANSGEPLAEITNSSSKSSRGTSIHSIQPPNEKAIENGSPKPRCFRADERRLQDAACSGGKDPFLMKTQETMPTPPTSSAEVPVEQGRVSGKGGHFPPSASHGQAIAAATPQQEMGDTVTVHTPIQRQSSTAAFSRGATAMAQARESLHPAIPILLSSTLSQPASKRNSRFGNLLQKSRCSFTFSARHFATRALSADLPAKNHVVAVLVDSTMPEVVAEEMKNLGRMLHEELQASAVISSRKGTVVFLHWESLGTFDHNTLSLRGTDAYFAGSLCWTKEFSNGRPSDKVVMKAIWDREETLIS